MKVIRKISSEDEIRKKIKEMQTYAEHWAIKWQASKESNKQSYQKMVQYQELAEQYATQLKKQQEPNEEIKLKNLYDDIHTATDHYLASHCSFFMSAARHKSIERLRQYSSETKKKSISTEHKLNEISSYLLKELNDTEKSHNQNPFSNYFTKSKLASTYMCIFEQNGIDPNNKGLIKDSNDFQSDVEEAFFSCFPKII